MSSQHCRLRNVRPLYSVERSRWSCLIRQFCALRIRPYLSWYSCFIRFFFLFSFPMFCHLRILLNWRLLQINFHVLYVRPRRPQIHVHYVKFVCRVLLFTDRRYPGRVVTTRGTHLDVYQYRRATTKAFSPPARNRPLSSIFSKYELRTIVKAT